MIVEKRTSVIALMYNHLETTKKCFHYLRKYTDFNEVEVIAVNNGSTDGTKEWLSEQKDIDKVIHLEENVGLAKGYNIGIKSASGEEVFLLANDILLTSNWLENLRACLYHDDNVGIISPIMNVAAYLQSINVDYDTLEEMEEFANSFNQSNPKTWQYRPMVVTCCAFAKKEVLERIGYFDERYPDAGSYSDVDLTLTATEAGYKNYVCYDTFVHHYGSQTISEGLKGNLDLGKRLFREKKGFCGEEDSGANYSINDMNRFIKNPRASFIEIGTGYGISSSIFAHNLPKVRYVGYEKSKKTAEIAGGNLNVKHIHSYRNISSSQKYDFVLLNRILEEKNMDRDELDYVLNLVSKGGVTLGYFVNRGFINNVNKKDNNLFTYNEIETLLKKKNYRSYSILPNPLELTEEEEEFCTKEATKRNVNFDILTSPTFFVLTIK